MKSQDLLKYGITDVEEIVYNPTYEQLFEEEMKPGLEGFEKGQLSELDAVNVMTGIFTGRSPKDKFIIKDNVSQDKIWWTTPESPNDNRPMTTEVWSKLKKIVVSQLSGKRLFVMDTFLGANENSRLKIRVITEVAWQA
ncbi:phosphoenolpyruvate carboxykinase (ATP), partial [bacterium]|nr:phosphoenolpyruvate carboxykinase (ATP) [bacterium]